jgi:hypothetical protein
MMKRNSDQMTLSARQGGLTFNRCAAALSKNPFPSARPHRAWTKDHACDLSLAASGRRSRRPRAGAGRVLFFACLLAAIANAPPAGAAGFKLHVPCTTSHDCPRGAFCRHETSFRGQCVALPQTPFGITGRRQIEFPPQSDPPEHLFGSMPILRCSQVKPCPAGFVCARYGSSKLEEALCVPYSEPCWSTADCSPADICDKPDEDFSLTGVCRPRESAE